MDQDHQHVGRRIELILPLARGIGPQQKGHRRQRRRDQGIYDERTAPHRSSVRPTADTEHQTLAVPRKLQKLYRFPPLRSDGTGRG